MNIRWPRSVRPLLLLAVAAGTVVRIAPAIGAGFPLGDGGLFAQMALDLRGSGFMPPETVTYYEAPWVYPPLGIYLLAAIPGDPTVTLRWLPVVWSVALIPTMWLLAKEVLGEIAADVAAIAYALLPWSFWWLIQGGGVTRALGAVLAVLAIWAAARRQPVLLGVFTGLTIATHPEAALFAAVSIALVWVVRWRSARVLLAVPVSLLLASTWLIFIIPRLGIAGLVEGAMSRAGGLGDDSLRKVIVLMDLWPVTLLGLVGVAVCLRFRKERWLILWALVCMLLPGAIGRWVAVPWAMLAAVAVEPLIELRNAWRSTILPVAAALTVVAALTTKAPLLPAADRTAMAAIAATVEPHVTYAVLGSAEVTEWFPFLARHHSTTTSVGYEWVGGIPPEHADRVYGRVGL
jgi:hypothetical protein